MSRAHSKPLRRTCVCSLLCLVLCDSMNSNPPGSSVHGIVQARILEWVAISSSRGSSLLRDHTCASYKSPALQAYSLPLSHQGNHNTIYLFIIFIVCLPLDNSSSINTGLSVSFVNRLNPNNLSGTLNSAWHGADL